MLACTLMSPAGIEILERSRHFQLHAVGLIEIVEVAVNPRIVQWVLDRRKQVADVGRDRNRGQRQQILLQPGGIQRILRDRRVHRVVGRLRTASFILAPNRRESRRSGRLIDDVGQEDVRLGGNHPFIAGDDRHRANVGRRRNRDRPGVGQAVGRAGSRIVGRVADRRAGSGRRQRQLKRRADRSRAAR